MLAIAFDDVMPHCSHNHISKLQTILAVGVSADSSRDDNLQLADMIVGAVRQHIAVGESQYYATFARKVAELWEAP